MADKQIVRKGLDWFDAPSSEWFGKGFVGPLAEFASGFARHLARQGYAAGSIYRQMRFLRLLSRWLLTADLGERT